MKMDRLACGFEVKFADGAAEGTFSGYGAVFGNEDLGSDVILKGAFRQTLKEWKAKKKLPKMLLQHGGYGDINGMLPIGVWTSMEEDDYGLKVEGRLYALDTDRGKLIHAGLKEGGLDGLSIGYRAKEFVLGTKPEEPWRTIKRLDLMEVSVVLFGMNPLALVESVKAASEIKTIREFETFLREMGGYSRAAAREIAERGFKSSEPRDEDGAMSNLLATLKGARAGLSAT